MNTKQERQPCEVYSRDEKGQFRYTTGNTKYKAKMRNGKHIDEHRLLMLDILGIKHLPKNIIVHHVNGNRKDNSIHNLAVMTITAHNRLHKHEPWNKGLTIDNPKIRDTIKKVQESRFITFLPKFKEAFHLQKSGKKLREIALIQGISRRQVSDRIKRYSNYLLGSSFLQELSGRN